MKKRTLYLLAFFILGYVHAFAQCAMCRTTAESDLKNGGSIGKGLNSGILFLMTFPYLILLTGAYFFFKKPIDTKIKGWRMKYFPVK